MARVKRSGRQKIAYRDFGGGVQTFTSPILLQDRESVLMLNVDNRRVGILSKVLGYSQVGATGSAGAIKGLAVFEQADGTKILLKSHLTKIYKWTGSAWTDIGATLTNNSTDKVFGVNAFIDSVDRIYFASGLNDDVIFWNGTSANSITDFKAMVIESYKDKLFFGNVKVGSDAYPIRLMYFDEGVDDVNNNNFVDSLAEPITALKEYSGQLHVFGENSVAQYDGYSFKKIPGTSGTTSARSVQVAEGRLLWFNQNGVYMFAGDGLPVLISRPVRAWVEALTSASGVSARIDSYNRYCLYIGDVTVDEVSYDDVELVYDVLLNSWTVADNRPFVVGTLLKDDGGWTSYAGDTANDKVYQTDSGNSNNTVAISSEWQSPRLDMGHPEERKNIWKAFITYKPQNTAEYLTVQYRLDGTSAWSNVGGTTDNIELSGTDSFRTTEINFPAGTCTDTVQFRITHSSDTSGFEIYEIRFEFDILK